MKGARADGPFANLNRAQRRALLSKKSHQTTNLALALKNVDHEAAAKQMDRKPADDKFLGAAAYAKPLLLRMIQRRPIP